MSSRLPIIQPGPAPLPTLPDELRGDGQRVHFVSLGCPKNRTDSEVMLARLGGAGYELSDSPEGADVIVVNTCTFIDAATTESVETVLEMAALRKGGSARKLVVSGCMAQRHHDALKDELPEVDAFVGTGDYHRILEVVARGDVPRDIVGEPVYVQGAEARVNTLTAWSAYVKILEGCPQRCTFCIIPQLRGDLMSRSMDVIVDEARALAARGVKELNLVGQDSNSWGRDIGPDRLPDLLRALNGVDGIEWIRLLYSYPAKFKDDLIDAFVDLDKVVPYIDMPLQHISNPILKAMRRGVSSDRTRKLLTKLRTRIPDVAIRTGFIVGFPGETEGHFEELMEFVEEQRFDNAGVFTFSPQDETPAAHLPNQVPEEVRQERRDRLMTLQQELHLENNTDQLGRVTDVLVEGMHPETELLWVGRTPRQAPEIDGRVLINDAGRAAFGDIVKVEITDIAGYDLVGHVLE
ncbi:MAG: 30S ribosomal protein S12 methylthiotransferase RimO [Deltaproteobacteria bacterium]|nr:30S ribosomal protein S12 methylthiotransferase RimO [Deltaproteobacteria bacterium]